MDSHRQLQRILILDDDADYRRLLTGFLGSVFEAVEVIEYDPRERGLPGPDFDWSGYDVLILDYDLQCAAGTGLDVLPHTGPAGQHFPATVMLTGAGDEDVAVRAMKSGVHDYLRKDNLRKGKLKAAIENAFEQQQLRSEGIRDLDAVREMARRQAEQMIEEFKARYEATRQRQEARLQDELRRLQEELAERQQALKQIMAEKQAAENARNAAREQLEALQARLDGTGRGQAQGTTELDAARVELEHLNRELAATRRHQADAEAELLRTNWKKEQQETAQQQLQEDLQSFSREMAEQETNYKQATERLSKMQETRAQLKARRLEEEMASNRSLLQEISGQLVADSDG